MTTFGIVEPVVVNKRTGRIVGGHQRVKAAEAQGIEQLPVVHVDLDETQEKQLNIALNRISGEFDVDKLAELLKDLEAMGADLDLTEKPVELAERALGYSSRKGENVLDLFGGSGSTMIAAERMDRHAFLMELDPAYCDVIVQRWQEFTGKQAEGWRANG